MVNEIEVTLRGHIGHDPNLITGAGKQSFLRLNVASTPRIRTREGEWGDGTTQWFAVKLFGAFAEHVAQSVRKGDPVLVRGRLEHEEYQTRDGEDRWTAVIVADAFGPDLRTVTAHVSRATRRAEPEGDHEEQTAPAAGGEASSAADRTGGAPTDETGAVDVSGFQEVPDEDVEAAEEDSMAARMSA
ncbi:single-stranded DNA-binding protein [Ruania albidiflava]|uniref:single-stranded DNA-binding protein n=1 Tax=Ruania albidiflava TaxID=366586 RepID=UPI0003B73EA7|nr:single-stranded DNA-binding protein [Ruania albidiflava]